jgi:hypothetical protein
MGKVIIFQGCSSHGGDIHGDIATVMKPEIISQSKKMPFACLMLVGRFIDRYYLLIASLWES